MALVVSGVEITSKCISPADCGYVLGEEIQQHWRGDIVVLSMAVATFGAFTSLTITEHMKYCENRAWYYILVTIAGLSVGLLTVWTMHFVGMGALILDGGVQSGARGIIPVKFELGLTFASAVAAWLISSIALHIVGSRPVEHRGNVDKVMLIRLFSASILIMLGVCLMHYMGMVSQSGYFIMEYDWGIIVASGIVAEVAAVGGLLILMILPNTLALRTLSALVIACAVNGMHYTGMQAATYTVSPDYKVFLDPESVPIVVDGLIVATVMQFINQVLYIICNYYGNEQRRLAEKRLSDKHLALMQSTIDVAFCVVGKLADYDLDGAEETLKIGNFATTEAFLQLTSNLRMYRAFLPHSLFAMESNELKGDLEGPNRVLVEYSKTFKPSLAVAEAAVERLLDPTYTLADFHEDMVVAYPELVLYTATDQKVELSSETTSSVLMSSGYSPAAEYQRTLGAFCALFCLLRLELDGREIFSFGVDGKGAPSPIPPSDCIGDDAKKLAFYNLMPWDQLTDLVIRAGMIKRCGQTGKLLLQKERIIAILTLTAIHDIMKNVAVQPYVTREHAPFEGYLEGEKVDDHDLALAYVLEHFPHLIPSYYVLPAGQRAPILFTQGKMGFNNGWLVQGEAPPGALFRNFKKVITQGRASSDDINFYFTHWLTDLAGSEPFDVQSWPGAVKFTCKFPAKVLITFLDSFAYIDRLATNSEVDVFESYLQHRFNNLVPNACELVPLECEIAAMRLALMAQGFEKQAVEAFIRLPEPERSILSMELAQTGCREQYRRPPPDCSMGGSGPAFLVYYGPALIQKAGPAFVEGALLVLAVILKCAREMFPLCTKQQDDCVTIRIELLKVQTPPEIALRKWHLKRCSSTHAEVAKGVAENDASVTLDFAFVNRGDV